jgi:hypothetical protein
MAVSPRMNNLLSQSPRLAIKEEDEVSIISEREFTGSVRDLRER